MRSSPRALLGRPTGLLPSWTASHHTPTRSPQGIWQGYSTFGRRVEVVNKGKSKKVIWAAAGGTLGGGLLFFGDEIKHSYHAAERSARVLSTLAVCVNDYRVVLKQHFDDLEEEKAIWKACHKRCAERTLKVLEKNGSIFIKLGQHLSSMGYLLPHEWTTTFVPLQDRCPVSSYESIEAMFLEDTGRRIDDDFQYFSKEPIGAASLAQVHAATLKGGQSVAVKVQHPSLKEWVPLDLALTRLTFKTLKRAFPVYDLTWLSDEMEFSLPQELDFELEGNNATMAREFFSKNTNFPLIIPKVMSAHKRILIMDSERGARIDNLSYLDTNHISRSEVSATLANIFNGNFSLRARDDFC